MKMTVADTDDRLYLNDGFGPTTWETNKALEKARMQFDRKKKMPRIAAKFVQPNLKFKPKLVDARETYALLIAHDYLSEGAIDFLSDCAFSEVTSKNYGSFIAYNTALIDSKFQSYIDFSASSFDIIQSIVLFPQLRQPKVHVVVEGPNDMDEVNSFRPDKMQAEQVAGRRIVLKKDWPVDLYVFDQRLYVSAEWDLKNSGLNPTLEMYELIRPE